MTARVFAPDLFEPKPEARYARHDAFIRAHAGIDPALIALDLGVSEAFVCQRQRKLKLRKCRNPRDRD